MAQRNATMQMRMRWVLTVVQSVGGWLVGSNCEFQSQQHWHITAKFKTWTVITFSIDFSGSINIEFGWVYRSAWKRRGAKKSTHIENWQTHSPMSKQQRCSFWGQTLDWFLAGVWFEWSRLFMLCECFYTLCKFSYSIMYEVHVVISSLSSIYNAHVMAT